jgi:lysophospholipase L1-like esterase
MLVLRLVLALCCLVSPVIQQQPERFADEIAAFEASDQRNPPPQNAVLFVGSSSIRLWTTVQKDFPELPVINRGFGGSVIADSVHYAPRIVIPYHPRLIVFYAGTNDIAGGESPEGVLKDFQDFVTEVRASLPKTRIAFISINPSVARWAQEDKMLAANRLISDYIKKSGRGSRLYYLDTHAKLLSADGKPRPEILRADGLHLNDKGYALWLECLRPQILKLARERG